MRISLRGSLISALICIALIFIYIFKDEIFFDIDFDKETWSAVNFENESNCLRGKMVHDLFKNHINIGDDRNKVEQLLGKGKVYMPLEVTYVLGNCAAFDYASLHLFYADDGKLLRYEVRQN